MTESKRKIVFYSSKSALIALMLAWHSCYLCIRNAQMVWMLNLQEEFTSAQMEIYVWTQMWFRLSFQMSLPHKPPQTQITACPSVFFQVMDIEILEFQVPTENNKMLLVWDIEPSHTKAQVHVSGPVSGLGEPLRSRSHVDTCVLSFRRSCTASSPALVRSTS